MNKTLIIWDFDQRYFRYRKIVAGKPQAIAQSKI